MLFLLNYIFNRELLIFFLFNIFMMFGFIDSASEHAVALLNFHHYACFFLLLVIVFVIWLLKMILKFTILERNLLGDSNTNKNYKYSNLFMLRLFTFVIFLLFSLKERSVLYFFQVLDTFSGLLTLLRANKVKSSYCIHKTMYPDLGLYVDSFPILPYLIPTKYEYLRSVKTLDLFDNYISNRSNLDSAGLTAIRSFLYQLPAFFPYERIRIPFHGPWNNAERMIIHNTLVVSYYNTLKYTLWSQLNNGSLTSKISFSEFNSFNLSFFSKKGKFLLLNISPKFLVGSTDLGKNDRLFKGYSTFLSNLLYFSTFYNSESRTLFYLFFQNVRHRKVLEWVWTCVPAGILMLLLYPSLSLLYCYDRPYITRPYLTFKAIGHQWYWSYEYSDYVSNFKELEHLKFDSYMLHEDDLPFGQFRLLEVDRRIVLPVGICIRLVTTSADVLHSWAVPALGVKIDAVPGRLNQFWIIVDRPGTFYGQCSELCGVNHGFMPIVAEGVDLDTFFDYLDAVYL